MPADGFRPLLTDVQSHAAEILRKLICVRHDQLHWMICRVYPMVKPEKVMRQLGYVGVAVNDGRHYLCPGCHIVPERIEAVDVMLHLCGGSMPIFDRAHHPCALVFFLVRENQMQAFRIYTPENGKEVECRAIAENQRDPDEHAAVFCIRDEKQIQLLRISRPHVFALRDREGGLTFLDAKL